MRALATENGISYNPSENKTQGRRLRCMHAIPIKQITTQTFKDKIGLRTLQIIIKVDLTQITCAAKVEIPEVLP